jgi:hypothetical protein
MRGNSFGPNQVSAVVAALRAREASLWHACGLTDFAGYLRLGGIGSPGELLRAGQAPATDDADPIERAHVEPERVLLDLDDVNQGFARGWRMLPNVHGAITLQLHPRVLEQAATVQVALRRFSDPDFDPTTDLLSDPDDLDRCFLRPAADAFPWSERTRVGHDLAVALDRPRARSVELALQVRRSLPLEDVVAVWVEPVRVGETQLIDRVDGLADAADLPLRIRRRTFFEPERERVWRDLLHVLADGERPLLGVWQRADTSPAFRAWAALLRTGGLDAQFARFGRSLFARTLAPLAASASADASSGAVLAATRVAAPVGARASFPPRERAPSVYACGHQARRGTAAPATPASATTDPAGGTTIRADAAQRCRAAFATIASWKNCASPGATFSYVAVNRGSLMYISARPTWSSCEHG